MIRDAIVFVLAGLAILGVLAECTGCKLPTPEAPLPEYCYDEPKFTAAIVACASTAPTKEASHTCRKAVQATCGIAVTTTDGGAP